MVEIAASHAAAAASTSSPPPLPPTTASLAPLLPFPSTPPSTRSASVPSLSPPFHLIPGAASTHHRIPGTAAPLSINTAINQVSGCALPLSPLPPHPRRRFHPPPHPRRRCSPFHQHRHQPSQRLCPPSLPQLSLLSRPPSPTPFITKGTQGVDVLERQIREVRKSRTRESYGSNLTGLFLVPLAQEKLEADYTAQKTGQIFSMGESAYGCRPRGRSVALKRCPCQIPISSVCRKWMIDERKQREETGPTCYDSFTYAQSPFAPVPEVLHTAESAAQPQVYKEFFHVWRGHSQSICAAASGSFGTAASSKNHGVPQAYRLNLAPAQLSCAPCSDPAQVLTSYSSGSLGGNIVAGSTSLPVISGDLSMDSSAVMSFPAKGAVNNHGFILFDAWNTCDAFERCQQVPQKMEALIVKDGKDGEIQVSENPSVVGRCSWNSSSMGMLKLSTRLQPRHYRPSTVCCTTSKSDALQKYKERIDLLQQELKNITNLIFEEQCKISSICDVQNTRPTFFIEKFDKIMSMEKTCRENDKSLKKLQTGLILNFDISDSLLSEVKYIHTQNQVVSKQASRLASRVHDYRARIDVESSWFSLFEKTIPVFSSKISDITSEIDDFQKSLLEMSRIIDDIASWDHSQDFESQLCTLRTIFRIWESINLSIKYSAYLLELAADLCSQSKNWRSIHSEKADLAERFHRTELDVEQNSPKLERDICCLHPKVDKANKFYVEKLVQHLSLEISFNIILSRMIYRDNSWPSSMCIDFVPVLCVVWLCHWYKQIYTSSHVFRKVLNDLFSWRFRKFNNRIIIPSVRTQGRGECSSVSTILATESLYKKKSAAQFSLRGWIYQDKEFIIKLSHNHLQDMVAQIFEMEQGKGKNKLHVCLDQMEKKGVLSESAYNHGATEVEDSHRYRIDGFEEIKAGFHEACNILKEGNVLIGNMPITTDYFSLGPDDIYDIPHNAIYETNSSGQKCSHCVVIVGFGVASDGTGYYVFQNSYGPNWGSGGYGRVTSTSLKRLYSPKLA